MIIYDSGSHLFWPVHHKLAHAFPECYFNPLPLSALLSPSPPICCSFRFLPNLLLYACDYHRLPHRDCPCHLRHMSQGRLPPPPLIYSTSVTFSRYLSLAINTWAANIWKQSTSTINHGTFQIIKYGFSFSHYQLKQEDVLSGSHRYSPLKGKKKQNLTGMAITCAVW